MMQKVEKPSQHTSSAGGRREAIVSAQMKHVIDTSEVLGTLETPQGIREVCASSQASYDETAGQLVIRLEAFLRNADILAKEAHFMADWLPRPEILRERVEAEEARDVAREIFHRWVRKIREAAPALHPV